MSKGVVKTPRGKTLSVTRRVSVMDEAMRAKVVKDIGDLGRSTGRLLEEFRASSAEPGDAIEIRFTRDRGEPREEVNALARIARRRSILSSAFAGAGGIGQGERRSRGSGAKGVAAEEPLIHLAIGTDAQPPVRKSQPRVW
jgi:hypothetical protein